MSMTVVKQQWDRAEAIWGREEANKLFGNQLNANTDGRVGAVGAFVGGVVDGCAGGMEGMSGTLDFGRSADYLNCRVSGGERCEMFSILMESNARLQEEYLELKEELRAWKGDVLSSLNAGFVDSLSKIGNKVTHELDRHSQQMEGLVGNSINSIGSAIFKSVTAWVVEQSISGIGVEIREGLLEDIEACVDRSTRKVQEDMKTINEKDWGEFREEIVRNFEKINCDKKCHDLLVSSGEKHGGEGQGYI